jgi:hypothetical protein
MIGYIKAPAAGSYAFRLSSDDGSMLWVNDVLVVDNDFDRSLKSIIGSTQLPATSYVPIRIYRYNAAGSGSLFLEWKPAGSAAFEAVPADSFRVGKIKLPRIPQTPPPIGHPKPL